MQALITKYRPKSLDEVIGQASVVSSLRGAIKKKSSRAFLFVGPSGCGKTTLARILAADVGCAARDVLEIDAATHTGIDNIRLVTGGVDYRPMEGGSKIVIIDEAHALSKAAFQALLKAIEDPPSWAYWALCTTEETKLPQTVVTRCTKYSLKPVEFDDLVGLLDVVVGKESMDIDEAVIDLCAKEASGSPRQALSNLAVCAEAKDIKEAKELLRSAIESEEAINLARALVKRASWSEVQAILAGFKDISPESIRHVVRAYVTKVILGSKREADAGNGLEILDAFSTPFHPSDGMSPVVLACGRIILAA